MGRMKWHTKCCDLVFLAVELEVDREVTSVAMQDQEAMVTPSSRFGVLIGCDHHLMRIGGTIVSAYQKSLMSLLGRG